MNKVTMFIWGLVIFSLWGVILFIAYQKQDKVFIDLSSNLKYAGKLYVKENKINLKFNESSKIFIEDLIEDEFIKDSEELKEYCIDSVIVHKGIFGYEYKVNVDCSNKE